MFPMDFIEANFSSFDHINLFYRTIETDCPKGILAVVHGWGEHSGRYLELFSIAKKHGFVVSALDLRGHGLSDGRRGHVKSWSEYHKDIHTWLLILKKKWSNLPLILLGHSMGGLIVAGYVEENQSEKIESVVLSAPLFQLALPVSPVKKNLGKLLSRLFPYFSLSNFLKPNDLTHDPDKIVNWQKDSLNHHMVSSRWFTEMEKNKKKTLKNANKSLPPILILHSKSDSINSIAGSEAFYKNLSSSTSKLIRYEGMAHEIFNELNRDTVFQDLFTWLKPFLKKN